jgi:hypothetical protein
MEYWSTGVLVGLQYSAPALHYSSIPVMAMFYLAIQ